MASLVPPHTPITSYWRCCIETKPVHSFILGLKTANKAAVGSVPRVLLRDTRTALETTVVKPSSPEVPDGSGRYQILGELVRRKFYEQGYGNLKPLVGGPPPG